MIRARVIPALLLSGESLVKTTNFKKPKYIGDPINTVRIFNELEVDELMFLDINASVESQPPNLKILSEIANECFMPLAYGGGIQDISMAKSIFDIGFEKVVLNSVAHKNPKLISELSEHYGAQAVVVSIDVKKSLFGKYEVWTNGGKVNTKRNPVEWASEMEQLGAGEILITSIDKEGTWGGFDLSLICKVTAAVNLPVIAHGGCGKVDDIQKAVKQANASAVALGSMVVYQQKDMGVLVNFPDHDSLNAILD
nr:AglZ/HisF2 family acetamidino modification protein [uncultured Sediminibacterium sp.]